MRPSWAARLANGTRPIVPLRVPVLWLGCERDRVRVKVRVRVGFRVMMVRVGVS